MIFLANRCFPPMYARGPFITKGRDVTGRASRIGSAPTEMPAEAFVHLSRQKATVKVGDFACGARMGKIPNRPRSLEKVPRFSGHNRLGSPSEARAACFKSDSLLNVASI
jgi:hypothetical protein